MPCRICSSRTELVCPTGKPGTTFAGRRSTLPRRQTPAHNMRVPTLTSGDRLWTFSSKISPELKKNKFRRSSLSPRPELLSYYCRRGRTSQSRSAPTTAEPQCQGHGAKLVGCTSRKCLFVFGQDPFENPLRNLEKLLDCCFLCVPLLAEAFMEHVPSHAKHALPSVVFFSPLGGTTNNMVF